NNPFIEATYLQQLATAFFTFLLYFKLLFFPHPLTHDYYPKQIPIVSFSEPLVLISILVHIILVYFLIKGTKNKHPIAFGLWLYFLSFSLYANILFPIGTLMNERFLYIPSIGFAIIIAFLAYQKFNEKRTVLISLLVTIGFLFSFKTVTRNYAWQNDEVLALT